MSTAENSSHLTGTSFAIHATTNGGPWRTYLNSEYNNKISENKKTRRRKKRRIKRISQKNKASCQDWMDEARPVDALVLECNSNTVGLPSKSKAPTTQSRLVIVCETGIQRKLCFLIGYFLSLGPTVVGFVCCYAGKYL
jgi:hypothetical protein